MNIETLVANLDQLERRVIAGALAGLQAEANTISDDMQATSAHGDITGATRANYAAIPVGGGADSAATVASMVAVVEALNPGQSSTDPVTLPDDALGVLITSATAYQWELETENAGRKAVLGPTLDEYREALTAAAARGIRRALT